MKITAFFLLILRAAASTYGAEWYESLPPGITRTEILKIAGNPSSTKSEIKSYEGQKGIDQYSAQIDRYDAKEGYIELTYDKETLIQLSFEGQHRSSYYSFFREILSSDQIQTRRNYLNSGQYVMLPSFHLRHFIRTQKYPGEECYPIDDSILIIRPMLGAMGQSGFFADKTAKVVLLDSERHETELYRSIDNWKNLRPPRLDDKKLKERAKLIAELAIKHSDRNFNIVDILGPPDSRMGSGIPYAVYYLEDGLVVGVDMKPQMKDVTILHPGE